MIDELLELLMDGRAIRALNSGYDAVVALLVDLGDSWLRAYCPAYALAADAAEAAGPEKARALKVLALTQALHELGLDAAIKAIIEQWQKAPATIKEAAQLYADAGSDMREVWNHPDLANVTNLIIKRVPDAYRLVSHVVGDVLNGNLQTEATANWALGFASVGNDQVAKLLDKWKLGTVASALRVYGGTVNQLTVQAVDVPLSAVDETWHNITHLDMEGLLKDLSAIGVAEDTLKLAGAVVKGVVSIATGTVDIILDVGSAVWNSIKNAIGGGDTWVDFTICANNGKPTVTIHWSNSGFANYPDLTMDLKKEIFEGYEMMLNQPIKSCATIRQKAD